MGRLTQYELFVTGKTDPTYKNIWAFSTPSQRNTWLLTTLKAVKINQKYWRLGFPIKIDVSYEDSFSIDYVRITNETGTNKQKIYYGFVISRMYISNNVTQLNISVDYIQTYYFNADNTPFWQVEAYKIKETTKGSFIPMRGLSSDYSVPTKSVYNFQFPANEYAIVIFSSIDLTKLDGSVTYILTDHVYMASTPYILIGSNENDVLTRFAHLMEDINNKGYTSAISNICLIPTAYIDGESLSVGINNYTNVAIRDVDFTVIKPTSNDGYLPTNKVLLEQDYTTINIINNLGEVQSYRFDDFLGTPKFRTRVDVASGTVNLTIFPVNLRNLDTNSYRMYGQKFTQVPLCSYDNDTYKIWLAQSQNSRAAAINAANNAIDYATASRNASLTYQLDSNGANFINRLMSATSNILANILGDKYYPFGGGQSRGGGAGRSFENNSPDVIGDIVEAPKTITSNLLEITSNISKNINSRNNLTKIGGLVGAWAYKQLGFEEALTLEGNVKNAQANLDILLASYADKAAIPATVAGSNAFGSMTILNQVGFFISVVGPTAEWAAMIDKMIMASGKTINIFSPIVKNHQTFDFIMANSPHILAEPNNRPEYVRNMLIGILGQGVYLWYVYNNKISDYFATPYNINNPEV